MRCPNCDSEFTKPTGKTTSVNGVSMVVLLCPVCQCVLGAVNRGD